MAMSDLPLEGKVALVTGGGRGLGRSMAEALGSAGAAVCITGRNQASLQASADQISSSTGATVLAVAGDVTDHAAMAAAVEACEVGPGPVDILIDNAGIGAGGPLAAANIDDWWRVFEVNLKGPLEMCRLVLSGMIARQRGRIINIGSYQGISAAPGVIPYATSKCALLRLTDSLAAEVIEQGVVVIALSPGFVRTDMGREAEAEMAANIPGFDGMDPDFVFEPKDIARLVVRVARGDADPFYGRLLHVRDDLDDLLSCADQIIQDDRFALRFLM